MSSEIGATSIDVVRRVGAALSGAAAKRAVSRFIESTPRVAALVAISLMIGACEKEPVAPTTPDPDPVPDPLVIDFMAGAPTDIVWGSRVTVTAFYPGQRSWGWLIGRESVGPFNETHAGAAGVRAGTSCLDCHVGPNRSGPEWMGSLLVTGDPEPVIGKPGWRTVDVQAAYDATHFYLKVRWASVRPGITHETYRYDGTSWVPNSKNRPAPLGPNQHYSYEDRLGVMISDANLRADPALPASVGYRTVGCWMTCHSNMRHMPNHPDVAGARAFIGQDDVRKYLLTSRDGDGPRSAANLAAMRAAGQYLDLWQFRAARGAPVNVASDDHVLEYRNNDIGGTTAFFDQLPNDMRWMYDRNVMGFIAIPMDEYEKRIAETPLISNGPLRNAVPFDPNAGFKPGDILPRRVLRTASGNRGDVSTYSEWKDSVWTVIFKRALVTDNTVGENATDKALDLTGGTVYTVGFGVFDDHVTSRRHYVTLPFTLGGEATNANIKARGN